MSPTSSANVERLQWLIGRRGRAAAGRAQHDGDGPDLPFLVHVSCAAQALQVFAHGALNLLSAARGLDRCYGVMKGLRLCHYLPIVSIQHVDAGERGPRVLILHFHVRIVANVLILIACGNWVGDCVGT